MLQFCTSCQRDQKTYEFFMRPKIWSSAAVQAIYFFVIFLCWRYNWRAWCGACSCSTKCWVDFGNFERLQPEFVSRVGFVGFLCLHSATSRDHDYIFTLEEAWIIVWYLYYVVQSVSGTVARKVAPDWGRGSHLQATQSVRLYLGIISRQGGLLLLRF